MKVLFQLILVLFISSNLYCQNRSCDSTFIFSFIEKGKAETIRNGYTITIKLSPDETYEIVPTPVSYRDRHTDSLIVDNGTAYVNMPNVLYDSLTIITYTYKDFKVSFKSEPLCRWGQMDFGVYIYHFSNLRQMRRYKKSGKALIHPSGKDHFKKQDFPLVLISIDTEEITVAVEPIE
jgi:hypothetical protein